MAYPKALIAAVAVVLSLSAAHAAQAPQTAAPLAVNEGTFVVKNYTFRSGESLPEVKLHYRTLGQIKKDARGQVVYVGKAQHLRNRVRQYFRPGGDERFFVAAGFLFSASDVLPGWMRHDDLTGARRA